MSATIYVHRGLRYHDEREVQAVASRATLSASDRKRTLVRICGQMSDMGLVASHWDDAGA